MKNVMLAALLSVTMNASAISELEMRNYEFSDREIKKYEKTYGVKVGDYIGTGLIVSIFGFLFYLTGKGLLGPHESCLKWYHSAIKKTNNRYSSQKKTCTHKKAQESSYNLIKSCSILCNSYDQSFGETPVGKAKYNYKIHANKQKKYYGYTELSNRLNFGKYTEYLFNHFSDFGKYDMYRCIENVFDYYDSKCGYYDNDYYDNYYRNRSSDFIP